MSFHSKTQNHFYTTKHQQQEQIKVTVLLIQNNCTMEVLKAQRLVLRWDETQKSPKQQP